MKVRLTSRGMEVSADLDEYVRRRAHFSLGRFTGKIRSLSIRLADANGPRGGVDKCCDIRVDTGLGQEVIVRERQASIDAAVAFAIERAERAVQRQLKSASTGNGMETARTVEFRDWGRKRNGTARWEAPLPGGDSERSEVLRRHSLPSRMRSSGTRRPTQAP